MKKILILLLSASLALTFAACTADTKPADDTDTLENAEITNEITDTAEATDTTPAKADTNGEIYTITLDNGTVISVGSYSEEAVSSLGTPIDIMEAPSCIHEGTDKVYTFDGFSITTSPDAEGGQYIAEFTLLSDLAALENGLTIGSPAEELSDMFGETYEEQFGVRTYTLDTVTVSVLVDGDTVSGITVSAVK